MKTRAIKQDDIVPIETLTRNAFWNLYKPGCDEHFLVHKLFSDPHYRPEYSLVATDNTDRITGAILYSTAWITDSEGTEHKIVTFGPLCVDPVHHGCGIGSMLVRESVELVKRGGERGIVILGYPFYYERFGFVNAALFGVEYGDFGFPLSLQVLEMYDGALEGVKGVFREAPVFHELEEEDVLDFDSRFPEKERFETCSQLSFSMMVGLQFGDTIPPYVISHCKNTEKDMNPN
eukprot:TRINITY_DN1431_c0_g1_i1.p1 TRINITY_DN1431_c0_g1~~TRINITY_DN1431_c0_g1_i1.p1  ORF type:complete len:234 (-),score=40.54 TRINITY_DN1431_c0_g1_i1:840-1541(-)